MLARYKSNKAKIAKSSLKIHALEFPKYSPDLMPLDDGEWDVGRGRATYVKTKDQGLGERGGIEKRSYVAQPCLSLQQ